MGLTFKLGTAPQVTTNYIPKANSNSFSNSLIFDNGTNIGIGTTSPNTILDVNGTINVRTNGFEFGRITTNNITGNIGGLTFQYNSSGTFTEGMRITGGGNVLVGGTNENPAANATNGIALRSDFLISINRNNDFGLDIGRNGTDGAVASFRRGSTQVGTISVTGSNTSYNTTSDYRLKQDLKEYNGLDLVKSIKTYDYEWKSDNSRMYGVLAHELQEVIPYAVYGEKDEVDENDEPKMQGVDYSKLVPVLVKAIQEQNQLISELSAKVSALENKS